MIFEIGKVSVYKLRINIVLCIIYYFTEDSHFEFLTKTIDRKI